MERKKLFWQLFPFLVVLGLTSFFTHLLASTPNTLYLLPVPVLLAVIICRFLSFKIGDPLSLLSSQAKRYLDGDYSKNLMPQNVSVEIKQLEQTLSLLGEKLRQSIQLANKQAKDREILFSSMLEGIATFNRQGNILHINQAAIDLNELEGQTLINRPVIEIFRHPIIEEMSRAILQGGKAMQEEIELKPKKILQVSASSLQDDEKNNWGGLFIFRDITRIRQLENHHQEFVANVSHELRTPLTSIQGFVETLLDNPDTKEKQKFLKIIQRQAGRLNSIIEDLLTLAHLEREQQEGQINFQKTKIPPIISKAIQTCEYKAREKNIQLEMEQTNLNQIECKVNASLLEQALINLIDNAIKYSESHSKVIMRHQIEQNHLVISVEDQGRGIHHSHINRLFERFYVIDKARNVHQGGTGLGLAIVKNIALLHGGDISVQSTPEKGSTFTIILPR